MIGPLLAVLTDPRLGFVEESGRPATWDFLDPASRGRDESAAWASLRSQQSAPVRVRADGRQESAWSVKADRSSLPEAVAWVARLALPVLTSAVIAAVVVGLARVF